MSGRTGPVDPVEGEAGPDRPISRRERKRSGP
jgi:hypothetical protein